MRISKGKSIKHAENEINTSLQEKESLKTKKKVVDLFNDSYDDDEIIDTKEKLDNTRETVSGEMPKDLNVSFGPIENLMQNMLSDTKSATGYKKVRASIKLYYAAGEDEARKYRALVNIYKSCRIYLKERSTGSKKSRKTNCENLVRQLGRYIEKDQEIEKCGRYDYLLEERELSDDEVDAEIRLAIDAAVPGKFADVSDRTRRNAFRRKIKDVRTAKRFLNERERKDSEFQAKLDMIKESLGIRSEEGINGADGYKPQVVDESLKAFLSIYDMGDEGLLPGGERISKENLPKEMIRALYSDDEDSKEIRNNKALALETMLSSMLTWDLNEFTYEKPEDLMKKPDLHKLMNKLELADNADVMIDELKRLRREADCGFDLTDNQLDEISARIGFLREISEEYRGRISLMSNPYYALLLEKDLGKLDEQKIEKLVKPDDVFDDDGNKEKKIDKKDPMIRDYLLTLGMRIRHFDAAVSDRKKYVRGRSMSKLERAHRLGRDHKPGAPDAVKFEENRSLLEKNLKTQKDIADRKKREEEARRRQEEKERQEEQERQRLAKEEEERKKQEELERQREIERQKEEERKKQEEQERQRRAAEEEERKKQEELERQRLAKEEEERKKQEEQEKLEKLRREAEKKDLNDSVKSLINEKRANDIAEREKESGKLKADKLEAIKKRDAREFDRFSKKTADKNFADLMAKREEELEELKKKKLEAIKRRDARELARLNKKIITKEREKLDKEALKVKAEAGRIRAVKDSIKAVNAQYEALKEIKAGEKDAEKNADAAREAVKGKFTELTGIDPADLEFIPTDQLYALLKGNIKIAGDTEGINEKLNTEFKDLTVKFAESDELSGQSVRRLMNKKDLSAAESQRLYEYSMSVMHRNTGIKDLKYDSLKTMDLEKLSKLALKVSECRGYGPDLKNEQDWSSVPMESLDKCGDAAADIMAQLSGVDAALFKLIPVAELYGMTQEALNELLNPEELKKKTDICVKRGEYIKDRMDRAKAAADSGIKPEMMMIVEELTGMDQRFFSDIPADRLKEVVYDLSAKAYGDTEFLEAECREQFVVIRQDFTEEKLMENMFAYKGKVDAFPDTPEMSEGFMAVSCKRDYALLYLMNQLGIKGTDLGIFEGENDDERFYTIARDISLIKRLKAFDDEESKEYMTVAVNELLSLDIPDEMMDKITGLLGMKLEKTDIKKETFEELKGVKADKEYVKNTELFPEKKKTGYRKNDLYSEIRKSEYEKHLEDLKNKKAKKAPKLKAEAGVWSEDSRKVINFTGDIVNSFTAGKDNTAVLKKLLKKNSSIIRLVSVAKENKDKQDPFADIVVNITAEQRRIFDEIRNITAKIADAMEANKGLSLAKLLESPEMDKYLKEASAEVEERILAFEKEVTDKMDSITNNIYDQVEGMGVLPLISDLDDQEASKKQKVESGRQKLDYMHNELLYDRNRGQGKFIEQLTSGYYKNASPKSRRFMLSYVIKDMKKKTEKLTNEEQGGQYFASAMKGAGPLMQKLIQGLPERMVVPELRDAVMVVKSSLRPIDEKYKNSVFETIKTESKGKITELTEIRSLGAASVAETFLCRVSGPKQEPREVVIKIKRPDAMERMEEELPFIRKCSRYADMSDEEIAKYESSEKIRKDYRIGVTESGFQAQFSAIEKEFDFKNEIANAERGEKNYIHKGRRVNTVKINSQFKKSPDYIVMDLAEGKTVDSYIRDTRSEIESNMKPYEDIDGNGRKKYYITPKNIKNIETTLKNLNGLVKSTAKNQDMVADLAYQWVKMAIFGSSSFSYNGENFHHGDLHSGNIMISENGTTVLDYGNCTVLRDEKVTQIVGMMVAVVANRTDFFVDAFDELLALSENEDDKKFGTSEYMGYSRMSLAQKTEFEKKLKEIFALGTGEDSGKKILLCLTVAQELGIKLPREIQNFSQCQQRLENSVTECKDLCMDIGKTMNRLVTLPVDPRYKDVPDPIIMLHENLQKKKTDGSNMYDSESAYNMVVSEFATDTAREAGMYVEQLDPGNQKNMEKFRRRYFCGFEDLKKIKNDAIFSHIKDFHRLKVLYKECRALVESDRPIPDEKKEELATLRQQFNLDILTSEILSYRNDGNKYINYMTSAVGHDGNFDEEDFEKLEYLFEEYLPKMLTAAEEVDNYLTVKKSNIGTKMTLKEKREYTKLVDKVKRSVKRMEAVNVRMDSKTLNSLRKLLLEMTDPAKAAEVEDKLSNMLDFDTGTLLDTFNRFKEACESFAETEKTGDREKTEVEKQLMEDAIDDFIVEYGNSAIDMLAQYKEMISDTQAESAVDPDDMADFSDKMASCLEIHYVRAAGKLGFKYESEIDRMKRMKAEAERKEKGIELTEKEKKKLEKDEADYRKSLIKDKKERVNELKKLEVLYKQKQAEKELRKKKAEEAEEERKRKELEKQRKDAEKLAAKKKKEAGKNKTEKTKKK
ncbi:MAG: hypothetical protein IKI75_00610 [Lachnospiraceae bacterium]|nr:hypothetical protein [Lachnospiraceae bacterium]